MDPPTAEAALLILGIVLAVLQIVHTLMGIRNDAGDDDEADGSER
jgi:hypothetical protein